MKLTKYADKTCVRRNERHVRWNWEVAPADAEMVDTASGSVRQVRYHFIVVDDRNREETMRKILQSLRDYGSIYRLRNVTGPVANSNLIYLFETYDSPVAPRMIRWRSIRLPVERDTNLRERKLSIEKRMEGRDFRIRKGEVETRLDEDEIEKYVMKLYEK